MLNCSMTKPKVLITYIEAGLGHIVSAKAISDVLHKSYGDKLDIIDDYVCHDHGTVLAKFEDALVKSVKSYSKSHLSGNFQYGLLKVFGDRLARWGMYNLVFGKYKKAMVQYFREVKPDVIVSTHFAVSDFAAAYRDQYNPQCKVVTYNPDYNTLGFWGKKDDLFIVNSSLGYQSCCAKKFDMAKVRQVPFIVREDLKKFNLSKTETRAKHGLPQNKFTVTVVDGAYGAARLQTVTDELLKTDREITLLVGACKNQTLYDDYQKMREQLPPNITLVPLAFRMDIFEFYRASDVVVTKSGAGIGMDCLFMNVPMIIDYCATGLEVVNRDFYVNELKIAEFIPNANQCRQRIEQFIDHPELLQPYVANTERYDKNNDGGREVADLIFAICQEPVL